MILKSNIAGIDVGDVDSKRLEFCQNLFDGWPIVFKVLAFLLPPIPPDLRRIVRRLIQISATEIQAKWRADDRHFDGEVFIGVVNENGNTVTENVRDFQVIQTQINIAFPEIGDLAFMKLDRHLLLGWIAADDHGTLGTLTKTGINDQFPMLAIRLHTRRD